MKPGVPVGIMIVEISGTSRPDFEVRVPVTAVAVTRRVMSVPEFVMKHLLPLIVQVPPSRVALVRVPPASDPASGSVRPKAARPEASVSFGSHSFFCSSVPKR